jgi:hypothetical protein
MVSVMLPASSVFATLDGKVLAVTCLTALASLTVTIVVHVMPLHLVNQLVSTVMTAGWDLRASCHACMDHKNQ